MEIINFENSDIRTLESGGQIWYSVVDVVEEPIRGGRRKWGR